MSAAQTSACAMMHHMERSSFRHLRRFYDGGQLFPGDHQEGSGFPNAVFVGKSSGSSAPVTVVLMSPLPIATSFVRLVSSPLP